MTIRTATPELLQAVRALPAEGLALGKADTPQDEESAAVSLGQNGYVDVHVGRTHDERLTIKMVQSIQAIHEGREAELPPASQRLLEDMRELQRHDQRFVIYNGQSGFGGFGRGDYHAYHQTTVPFPLAFSRIDAGATYGSGTWGWHPILGLADTDHADGSIDRYVASSSLSRTQVAYLADSFRAQDRLGR